MRSITAVEIGADICALARTSVSGGNVHLWAAETLDPGAFPGVDAFTQAVRQARHALKLPRRCHAVVWGLPDGARRRDPVVVPLIEPLTKAGFKVARVVTPCNAHVAHRRRDVLARDQPQRRRDRRRASRQAAVLPFVLLGLERRRERQPGAAATAVFARRLPRAGSAPRDRGG